LTTSARIQVVMQSSGPPFNPFVAADAGASALPAKMQAVVASAPGGPGVLRVEQRPVPVPGPEQVLIRTAYAGVNRHDCGQRRRGAPPKGATDILGLEVAGDVVRIGPQVDPNLLGASVCALVNGGGYAEYCLAEADLVFAQPAGFDMKQTAALPEALFTAWFNLVDLAGMKSGDWVLVHGGTSGVGSIAIQIARLVGARVVTTAGTAEKCALCIALGAERAINYREQDFVTGVHDATVGHGADIILDMVGGGYAEKNLAALAKDGRIVHLSSGNQPDFSAPLRLIMEKRAIVTGSLMRPLEPARKRVVAEALRARIWPVLGTKIRPLMDQTFPLARAGDAHARMEAGLHAGKILLATGNAA
jgi:putative PIG3 family NAD(P)H quinone oxidoreductase